MIKNNLKALLLLCLVSTVMISCGGNSNEVVLKYVTDKTLAVSRINLNELDGKLPKDEIAKDPKMQNMSDNEKEAFQLLMNGESAGINMDEPMYVMVDNVNNDMAVSILMSLDDVKIFEQKFSKLTRKEVKVDAAKKTVYAGSELIGTLDDDVLILSKFTNYNNNYGQNYQETDEKYYADFRARKATENESVQEQIKMALTEDTDMSLWVNLHGVINTASKGYIESLAVNKLLLNAALAVSVRFEKGEVVMASQTHFNDEMRKVVEKYYQGKGVNYDMVKNIELDDTSGYGIGFFSMDLVRYMVKEAGLESAANNMLASQELTLDDVMNAFTGDFAYANFKYFQNYSEDNMQYGVYPKQNMLLALGIDKAKGKKMMDFINTKMMPMIQSQGTVMMTNSMMVFATEPAKLESVKKNKIANNTKLNKESGLNSISWMDGSQINEGLRYTNMRANIKDIVSKAKVTDGAFTSEIKITLDKNKENEIIYFMVYE